MTVNFRQGCKKNWVQEAFSPNTSAHFVSREIVNRKITGSIAKVKPGRLDVLEPGILDAQRDWGYAKEYVEGMWRMLQADEMGTFVLTTNRTETVRHFMALAFKAAGIELKFHGRSLDDVAADTATEEVMARVNPNFHRPAEGDLLNGDSLRALSKLVWRPETTLEQLCDMMVPADLQRITRGISF